MNRALFVLLLSVIVGSAVGESTEPPSIRITTWNLEWFPNGSAHDATAEAQAQRITAAADVLRSINPDVILLQEVRDYDVCARLGEAIAPGIYHVVVCSAFKEPFQSGLGKQQVAILSKYYAQAEWSESWKSMNGVDPPRGFAFAWFKIGSHDIGVYSVHLESLSNRASYATAPSDSRTAAKVVNSTFNQRASTRVFLGILTNCIHFLADCMEPRIGQSGG